MSNLQIVEFGEYLLTRSFCDERQQKFYLYWVRRFFKESKAWQAKTGKKLPVVMSPDETIRFLQRRMVHRA